jgi:hypothetical protein
MKKLLNYAIAAAILAAVIFSCKEIKPIVGFPPEIPGDCPGCTAYTYGVNSPGTGGGNLKGLNKSTATVMAGGYISNCQPKLSGGIQQPPLDARSVWFSVETLKEFIYNIEKANCNNGCSKKLELGIRIYYAQYPSGSYFTNMQGTAIYNDLSNFIVTDNPLYQKNHTVFMVPTFDNKIGKTNPAGVIHIDFDPWHMGNDCNNPLSIAQLDSVPGFNSLILAPDQPQFGRLKRSPVAGGIGLTNNSMIQNHGGLVPPDDPKGNGF